MDWMGGFGARIGRREAMFALGATAATLPALAAVPTNNGRRDVLLAMGTAGTIDTRQILSLTAQAKLIEFSNAFLSTLAPRDDVEALRTGTPPRQLGGWQDPRETRECSIEALTVARGAPRRWRASAATLSQHLETDKPLFLSMTVDAASWSYLRLILRHRRFATSDLLVIIAVLPDQAADEPLERRLRLSLALPGESKRTVSDALVSGADILPTALEWIGGGAAKTSVCLTGRSLLPLIDGREATFGRRYVFASRDLGIHGAPDPVRIVRNDRFRLVHRLPRDGGIGMDRGAELHDLMRARTSNVIDEHGYRDAARELGAELATWCRQQRFVGRQSPLND